MAHVHEKVDFCAEVFIVFGDKILLRKHDKYKIWLSVGGHIDLGEDPNEAAVREVKEEVGLDVTLWDGNRVFNEKVGINTHLIPPVGMLRHHINDVHEHVVFVYFGRATSDKVVVEYEGDRSDDWRWLTREELDTIELRPDIKFYAQRALDELASH